MINQTFYKPDAGVRPASIRSLPGHHCGVGDLVKLARFREIISLLITSTIISSEFMRIKQIRSKQFHPLITTGNPKIMIPRLPRTAEDIPPNLRI